MASLAWNVGTVTGTKFKASLPSLVGSTVTVRIFTDHDRSRGGSCDDENDQSSEEMHVVRVLPDPDIWQTCISRLERFYRECLLPELAESSAECRCGNRPGTSHDLSGPGKGMLVQLAACCTFMHVLHKILQCTFKKNYMNCDWGKKDRERRWDLYFMN